MRININGDFYKLKKGECAQISADQFEILKLEARPSLIQLVWLEACEAKKDNDICDIEEGSWLNLCQYNNCVEVANYEIGVSAGDPFIKKMENKNTNICLDITDS